MNILHRRYCRSDEWRQAVHHGMMPWVLGEMELGANVLEIGPGPGVTTDWLRERVASLTCIEIDRLLADALKERLDGTGVTVVEGDATAMPFPDGSFDAAVCFTMLHHVPSRQLQDRLLAETDRVLRPGGVFTGSDSTASFRWRLFCSTRACRWSRRRSSRGWRRRGSWTLRSSDGRSTTRSSLWRERRDLRVQQLGGLQVLDGGHVALEPGAP